MTFQTHRAKRRDDKADWPVRTVARTGQPPLRFAARQLAHSVSGDGRLFITLLARKRGGFVVVHSFFDGATLGQAAVTLPDLDAAVTYLEDLCKTDAVHVGSGVAVLDYIDSAIRMMAFRQSFAVLVGEALAHWDAEFGPLATLDQKGKIHADREL